MIKLKYFDASVVNTHLNLLTPHVLERLRTLQSDKLEVVNVVNTPFLEDLILYLQLNVTEILQARPAGLRRIIARTAKEFKALDRVLVKSAQSRSGQEKDLVAGLFWVFDYKAFCNRPHPTWNAYALVEKHQLRICPYCHASHLNFHIHETKDMRPPLDHFYPRSRYPYLSISLYNLIPSCYQCNSSVKGAKNPLIEKLRHPFELNETDIKFRLLSADPALPLPMDKMVQSKHIKIEVASLAPRSLPSVEFFILQDRYQWYTPEIAEVHARVLSQRDKSGVLGRLVSHKRYVYGFNEKKARQHALGKCIKDIADGLTSSYSP